MNLNPRRPALANARNQRGQKRSAAFTMIEIAISLAVIGFALVAIIGILPAGMNVQKENREETIINQDATVFLNAIRNGERGLDDLVNYVVAITNVVYDYTPVGGIKGPPVIRWYTRTNSSASPDYRLTNGYRIIGLLSTPKYITLPPDANNQPTGFLSNHVVAIVHSLSGPVSDKYPQTNQAVMELGFSYRLICSVLPYVPADPWSGVTPPSSDTNQFLLHSNYWLFARNLQNNLHDLRLTFLWPYFPGNKLGEGRQPYRASVSGQLTITNEPGFPNREHSLYFFQPRSFVKAP